MKSYTILFSLLICLCGSLQAQTARGTKFVGKPIYFDNFAKMQIGTISGQLISPSIYGGFFIKKDLALGAGIKSSQSLSYILKNPSKRDMSFYGLTRQYINTPVRNLKIYGQAELAFNMQYVPGISSGVNTEATQDLVNNSLSVGATPGVAYFLTPRVSVDAFASGLQVDITKLKSTANLLNLLPAISRVGVGVSGNIYF
jgi:hypothetical protein